MSTSHDTKQEILNNLHPASQLQYYENRVRELEVELKAARDRFDFVQRATSDATWDWDLVNNTGWYSDVLTELFGYNPSELLDGVKFWYEHIHPEDEKRVISGIHAVIEKGGHHWKDEYRFRRADGSYAWVFDRGYVIHNETGQPVRMVGSMQDVSLQVESKERLRESEEKFRATFNQAAVGISISTPEGKFIQVNEAYPKIFGYSQEEFSHMSISSISHPDELDGDKKIIGDLLTGKMQIVGREKKYLHRSGEIIWGRVFGTIVYDGDKNPKYIVGVLEDITEQRKAEELQRENDERLRLVIDAAQIGIWDFEPLTGKLMWDARCKQMFGMAPDDHADYEIFLKGIHPEDRAAADTANQNAMQGVDNGEYDLEYRTIGLRDGKLRWVRAKGRSYKNVEGVTYRYAGTVIDITEQKLREQHLREQEQRFRLLANSIPQIVWTTDEGGVVDYISGRWETCTGQKPTYDNFSFRELMHPDDRPGVVAMWNECMEKGVAYSGEYRLQNIRTNEYRWYSCTTAPLRDDTGKVIKWVGSATDIHDQKTAKENLEIRVAQRTKELSDLNNRLEKSNEELEQYAYVTSHDLKEPLRKVLYYASFLIEKINNQISADALNYVKRIESSAVRMNDLIGDLLNYSKLAKTGVTFETIDLNQCLKELQHDFEHTMKEKNVTLVVSELPVIKGVPPQMQQLFANLLGNSIKFSKPNTPNTIRITSSRLTTEQVSAYPQLRQSATYAKIVFSDEGIGFDSAYSEQIFSIFHRLNQRTQFEGHGIGLALCRKIVHNHKGQIFADGREGEGATFTILLPE